MVLGIMVLCPWYFVDLVKGTTTMFKSRVNGFNLMNSSACIYMYCKIERGIMKNKVGSPDLGSRGKYLCIYVLCFMLSLLFIFCFKSWFVDILCTGLKPTCHIIFVSASRGCL